MTTNTTVQDTQRLATNLRTKLERTHPEGSALREQLTQLSDAQLVAMHLEHEEAGRDHAAKRAAERFGEF